MKKYAVIGNPISHSLSPKLHNYWFKENNIDAVYDKIKLEEHEIKSFINKIKDKEIKGINVTLPYKKSVIPFLNKIINDAKETRSVNTIMLDKNENLISFFDLVNVNRKISIDTIYLLIYESNM